MAKYLGLWYGGSSYAAPNGHDPRDCEYFASLKEAGRTLQRRADNDDRYTPCVDDTSEMHLYRGGEYHENGPDMVLTIGPRGGVRRDC